MTSSSAPLMLFDGVCNVCNAAVQFVVRHERSPEIHFASLQSELGRKVCAERGLSLDIDTVILVDDDGRAYDRSSAAVRILRRMKAPWSLLWPLLWVVPKPLRDLGYDLFAHFRYRLFGKRDACMVPTPELRARFLG